LRGAISAVENDGRLAVQAPDLDHEPRAVVHVEPGKKEKLVWRFTRVGILEYGCFVPGPDAHASRARATVSR
jgi:uncharacterized cupredoxin-like copper-binding protein